MPALLGLLAPATAAASSAGSSAAHALEPPIGAATSEHAAATAAAIAALNERFAFGRPSNSLHEAGVVVRQVDREDSGVPWRSSTAKWIVRYGLNDRLSASIVSARLPFPYSNTAAGLVLRPSALEAGHVLACACPRDCGTFTFAKSTPLYQQCLGVAPGNNTRWRKSLYLPSNLTGMLAMHERRFLKARSTCVVRAPNVTARDRNHCRYNELLLSVAALNRTLPNAAEAVFYPLANLSAVDRVEGNATAARRVRAAFAAAFGVRLPLLTFDVLEARAGRPPFAAAPAEADDDAEEVSEPGGVRDAPYRTPV